jgi:hypothetical protein
MPALANRVERRLAAEHEGDEREGSECAVAEVHPVLADGQDGAGEGQEAPAEDDASDRQVADSPPCARPAYAAP